MFSKHQAGKNLVPAALKTPSFKNKSSPPAPKQQINGAGPRSWGLIRTANCRKSPGAGISRGTILILLG